METLSQLTGAHILTIIATIATTAATALTHRENCNKMATHVNMIGALLEKLKTTTPLFTCPAAEDPLQCLEESLMNALELVNGCRAKSCMYMLAIGWNIVYDFCTSHREIDECLNLVPLVALSQEYGVVGIQEELRAIEDDRQEYFLDGEDMEAQKVMLKLDRTTKDAKILEMSLSRHYPDLGFNDALTVENDKLNIELQEAQDNNDVDKCRLLEQLIGVAELVVNVSKTKVIINAQTCCKTCPAGSELYEANAKSCYGNQGLRHECASQTEWQTDIFGCFREPCLSLVTCLYPCGTFSWIANVVSKGEISRERAVHDLMTYTIFCCCCCYTYRVRRKLRTIYNIEGSSCDDFLTHLMCCCCAFVQEWRELEVKGHEGCQIRKMIPPPFQYMM